MVEMHGPPHPVDKEEWMTQLATDYNVALRVRERNVTKEEAIL